MYRLIVLVDDQPVSFLGQVGTEAMFFRVPQTNGALALCCREAAPDFRSSGLLM